MFKIRKRIFRFNNEIFIIRKIRNFKFSLNFRSGLRIISVQINLENFRNFE